MVAIGAAHFISAGEFVRVMPPWVPWHLAMVYVSGVFEIAGGVGLLLTRTRAAAGWGLIALYVAVFPANLHMALNEIPLGAEPVPSWVLWARLPFQLVFIAWAYWVSREDAAP